MADAVDPKVVVYGAAVQIVIAVPPALVVSALRRDDMGAESNLWLVAALFALVVGPAVAGVLVGRRRPDSPLLHGALASGAAWALVAVVGLLRAVLADDDVAELVASLLTIAPIQIGIGVLGAFFARPTSRPEGDPALTTANEAATTAATDPGRGAP